MLIFLPALLIVLSIIGLLVLRRTHLPIGTLWLLLAVFALLNWGALLFLRMHLPESLEIPNWFPLSISVDPLILGIGKDNWYLIFALASVLVGIIFTSSIHLQKTDVFSNWIEILTLTAVGMIALLAQSPLAFLIMWALIDIVELIVFTIINQEQKISVQTYTIFIGRALGLGLVIAAMVLAYQTGSILELTTANGNILTLLIAGVSLRLGVLPLHLPYTQEFSRRRSLGTILRLLVPLSAFAFLSKLAVPQFISGFNLIILILGVLSSLFGAINWFVSKDELAGRPYWLLAFSGLAICSYFHGQPGSVIVWGVLLATIGGWIFLSELRLKKIGFTLPIALVGIVGFPFTPAAAGFVGIIGGPLQILNIFFWISLVFLIGGLIKFLTKQTELLIPTENWMKLFYTLGLSLVVLSPWVILLFKADGWNETRTWWVSAIILFPIAAVMIFKLIRQKNYENLKTKILEFLVLFSPISQMINRFFHFDWLYKFLGYLFNLARRGLEWINLILEGESGILWALVFLALLVSLLVNNGVGNG
ncbi:MAG: hypothetical protein AB9897_02665 [Anaerolineaceae bacterium]